MVAVSSATAGIVYWLDELVHWLIALDRPFAFLLALPFIVALAGLAAEFVRQRRLRPSNCSNGGAR
jgi:hypothetical protein